MFSARERERVSEIRQGDQRNRAKGRIKTLREKKNGGEIGTRKATQLHPQRSLSLSLSLSHQFTETMFRIFIFRFWFCLFRWEGVRMGPDFGGSEHVHKSSTKRSFQAILLQDSVQAPRTRHQRKPSLPQCLFLNFKIFVLFLFWLLCMVLWVLWISLMSLNYWFWFSSQHELASPVKTDSSFWTLGNLFILFCFLCFFSNATQIAVCS